jgi:4-pyridoxolactonase
MRVLPFEKPVQEKEQTLDGALSLVGLTPGDIEFTINSHYHFDHCGGNRLTSNATYMCHEAEYEACLHYQPFEKLGYSDLSFASQFGGTAGVEREGAVDSRDRKFQTVSGDVEIAEGLTLLETFGHTAGHCSLLVEISNSRPMLFAADAVYSRQSMDLNCISSFHFDPVAAVRSMERIRELAVQKDAVIFYGHDPEEWPSYRKAPEYYA